MKSYLKILLLADLIVAAILISCQKETTSIVSHPSYVKVYLTDHDTPVFDSVFIDIQKLEVKIENDTTGAEEWITLAINPGVYNILRFRNGLDTLFATGNLPNANLKKLRLTLGTQNSVMKDNLVFPLKIKDNERQVVVDIENGDFEFTNQGQVLFWIDFDAARSIEVDNSGSDNNNGYELRAHIKVFCHRNTGRIEGKVLPLDADPVVMAISGADTATAIPGNDGEFKIVGLTPNSYTVIIDGNNGYRDTTITNVVVRSGEDTDLPLITLRQ